MTDRNFIHYYTEPVKSGYSIMREDIVIDGELVQSQATGSPAPTDTVKAYIARNYGPEGKLKL
jgi:hypothetical protein